MARTNGPAAQRESRRVSPPSRARGTFAGTATLSATLTTGGSPLAGKTVEFTLTSGGTATQVGSATTDANGVATLSGVSLAGFNAGTATGAVGASFAGDATMPPATPAAT